MFKVIENLPHIAQVSDRLMLNAEDGIAFYKEHIEPFSHAIIHGHKKLIIVVPENRGLFDNTGRRTIQGAFFMEAFRPLLAGLRDQYFPQLKHQAARENIRSINDRPLSIEEIAKTLFSKSWETYDCLETVFWEKISIGLLREDGSITLAQMGAGREFQNEMETEADTALYHWTYQLVRGLDAAFSHDLNFKPQSLNSSPSP